MSKGNLFLGLATGKIGSVVLYRAFGEERARSWLASKRNPRTWRQAVQRSLMKTAQVAYSSLMPLCRSSFQGFDPGTPSQAAFVSRNLRLLRGRVQSDIDAGREAVLECAVGNYNGASDEQFLANPLMVSDGGLPSLSYIVGSGALVMAPGSVPAVPTYADVVRAIGCGQGDVLDVVLLYDGADGVVGSYAYYRVVLEPSDADMSSPFIADGGYVNKPNAGNVGRLQVSAIEDGGDYLLALGGERAVTGGAVVRSRMYGSLRQVSPQYLLIDGAASDARPLGAAVASFMPSSDVYLDGG